MLWIGAGERVDDIDVLARQERDDLVAHVLVVLLGDRVVAAPPDPVLRSGLAHDVLVLRRPDRELPRVEDDRPGVGELAVAVHERGGIEPRGARVAMNRARRVEPVGAEVDLVELVLEDRHRGSDPSDRARARSRSPQLGRRRTTAAERTARRPAAARDGRTSPSSGGNYSRLMMLCTSNTSGSPGSTPTSARIGMSRAANASNCSFESQTRLTFILSPEPK